MGIQDFIANGQLGRLFEVQARYGSSHSTIVGFNSAHAAGRTLSLLAFADDQRIRAGEYERNCVRLEASITKMSLALAEALAREQAPRAAGIRGGLTKARWKLERQREVVASLLAEARQADADAATEFEEARQNDPDDVVLVMGFADQALKERLLGLIGAYVATP